MYQELRLNLAKLLKLAETVSDEGNLVFVKFDGERQSGCYTTFIRMPENDMEVIRADRDTLSEALSKILTIYFGSSKLEGLLKDIDDKDTSAYSKVVSNMEIVKMNGNIGILNFDRLSGKPPWTVILSFANSQQPAISVNDISMPLTVNEALSQYFA